MLTVFCQTRFEGFHKWAKAPHQVKFLRDLHRHEFHVRVEVKVDHADRDVEFLILKYTVDACIAEAISTQTTVEWSCEHWATYLLNKVDGATKVEVSEDGENGAVVSSD